MLPALVSPCPTSRWLCNETLDAGTRHWAAEGLAFLTLDADVKEELMEDHAALQALFQLAQVELLWELNKMERKLSCQPHSNMGGPCLTTHSAVGQVCVGSE